MEDYVRLKSNSKYAHPIIIKAHSADQAEFLKMTLIATGQVAAFCIPEEQDNFNDAVYESNKYNAIYDEESETMILEEPLYPFWVAGIQDLSQMPIPKLV